MPPGETLALPGDPASSGREGGPDHFSLIVSQPILLKMLILSFISILRRLVTPLQNRGSPLFVSLSHRRRTRGTAGNKAATARLDCATQPGWRSPAYRRIFIVGVMLRLWPAHGLDGEAGTTMHTNEFLLSPLATVKSACENFPGRVQGDCGARGGSRAGAGRIRNVASRRGAMAETCVPVYTIQQFIARRAGSFPTTRLEARHEGIGRVGRWSATRPTSLGGSGQLSGHASFPVRRPGGDPVVPSIIGPRGN